EDMIISLVLVLCNNTSSFKQIVINSGTSNKTRCIEIDFNKFTLQYINCSIQSSTYKSGRVVILDSFCISKCFQKRICSQNCLFQLSSSSSCTSNICKILNNLFCIFSFSSTRFSCNQHGLIYSSL